MIYCLHTPISVIDCKTVLTPINYKAIKYYSLIDAGVHLIVTSNATASRPFFAWPGNTTLSTENTEVDLYCVVQNCNNGPTLIVGQRLPECEFEPSTGCLRTGNPTSNEGVWIIERRINLTWLLQSTCGSSLPVPVMCEIGGGSASNTSYIHVNFNHQKSTTTSKNQPPSSLLSSTSQGTSFSGNNDNLSKPNKPFISLLVLCIVALIHVKC